VVQLIKVDRGLVRTSDIKAKVQDHERYIPAHGRPRASLEGGGSPSVGKHNKNEGNQSPRHLT